MNFPGVTRMIIINVIVAPGLRCGQVFIIEKKIPRRNVVLKNIKVQEDDHNATDHAGAGLV